MAKKRKSYGKTAKQWDKLYKDFKKEMKYERIEKYTKEEFKKIWINREKGKTVKDIARDLRKDKFIQYDLSYLHTIKKGFELSAKLNRESFEENLREYGSIKNIIDYQRPTSIKEAKKKAAYLEKMSKEDIEEFADLTYEDFLYDEFYEENELLTNTKKKFIKERLELVKLFENFISDNNLWDEVYSYGG